MNPIDAIARLVIRCVCIPQASDIAIKLSRILLYYYITRRIESNLELCKAPITELRINKNRVSEVVSNVLESLSDKRFEKLSDIMDTLVGEIKRRFREFVECEPSSGLKELLSNPLITDARVLEEKIELIKELLKAGLIDVIIVPRGFLSQLADQNIFKIDIDALIDQLEQWAKGRNDAELLNILNELKKRLKAKSSASVTQQTSASIVTPVIFAKLAGIQLDMKRYGVQPYIIIRDSSSGSLRHVNAWDQLKNVLREVIEGRGVYSITAEHLDCLVRVVYNLLAQNKSVKKELVELLSQCIR